MTITNQPYSITKPFDEGYLPESNGHKIWYCQAGRPDGLPAIMLHGGPGYFSRPESREIFDPSVYRIIQFDQRGGGKSEATDLLKGNTTQDLLNDIERLRVRLEINQFVLFGSSWGSTLALLYAQQHPERVSVLLLKSAFLARESDLSWSEEALAKFLPEIDQKVKAYKQKYQLSDYFAICASLLKQLQGNDSICQKEAINLLEIWESNLSGVDRRIVVTTDLDPDPGTIAGYQIMLHYMINRCFLTDNQILVNMKKIKQIPTWIVHGRYDLLSPIAVAFGVAEKLDDVRLEAVLGSGHTSSSRLNEACQTATDAIARQLN